MTTPPLRACPHCGENEFAIVETYVHIGSVDAETGILHYKGWPDSGGRESISCAVCEHAIPEDDFAGVEYS